MIAPGEAGAAAGELQRGINGRGIRDRAGQVIQRVIAGRSFTGVVFGIAQTEVNPPAAAAAVPLAMVSLCACPGSLR